jgi:hypothetical protein
VNAALWLLIALQRRGWLRSLGRSLRTLKGALLAAVGLAVFVPWLLSLLLTDTAGAFEPGGLRRVGPAALLGYCLLNVLFSSNEKAVYFSPAEVNFLFTGPFGRREVLAYKLLLTGLVGLPTALLMSVFVRVRGAWFPASFLGVLLIVVFLQLFSTALSLLGSALGARFYTRGRRLALGLALVLGVLVLVQAGGSPANWDPRALAERVADTPAWRLASLPLSWFFDTILARRLWPDLVVSCALSLLVDLALLGLVFGLDAHYLEASAAASARLYARIQRLRGRSVGAAGSGPAGPRSRWQVPSLPWWGGVGPIFWRQLTTALRGLGRLVLVLLVLGTGLVAPMLAGALEDESTLLFAVLALTGWLTIFLTALVPFDFRGDLDRMALLKTLPLTPWRLAVGQLLTPVLLLSVLQWLALAAMMVAAPAHREKLLVGSAFVPPFNFLLFALENLLFLLFPVRLMAATPGDFQALGRNVLLALAKVTGLVVVGLLALLVGVPVWLLTGSAWLGAAAAWPMVALSGAALVPLVAIGFTRFDVGRDTPA